MYLYTHLLKRVFRIVPELKTVFLLKRMKIHQYKNTNEGNFLMTEKSESSLW